MSPQELDPTGAKILDGATRVLRDFGVKRATVELVAKYAGVSHMTIYRRWPSKGDLLRTAVVGEFTEILDQAFDQAGGRGGSFSERSLIAFTDIVWTLRNHPLVIREMDSDSGEQLPVLSSTSGSIMDVSLPLIAERLTRLDSAHDTPDAASLADVFVRLAHSMVVVSRPGQPLTTREQVADYARECFGPYLQTLSSASSRPDGPRPRPYLQIAAALVLTVLALGVGLTAGRSTDVKLPFITPANVGKSPAPAAPSSVVTDVPAGRDGTVVPPQAEPSSPAQRQGSTDAGAPVMSPPRQESGIIQAPAGPIGSAGSVGGGSAPDTPALNRTPPPPPPQVGTGPSGGPPPPPPPGPKPPPPKPPPPPGSGPGTAPGPRPPAAGPANPGPGPANPGPANPGAANPGPPKPAR